MDRQKIAQIIVETWAKHEASDVTWEILCEAAGSPDESPTLSKMHATALAEADAIISYMTNVDPARDRAAFEAWLLSEHLLNATWNNERNCYDEFPAHLAFKAWQARRRLSVDIPQIPQDIVKWHVGKENAIYEREDGTMTTVPLSVYRVWEAGAISTIRASTKSKEIAG